jgi:prevent-host-death family protein
VLPLAPRLEARKMTIYDTKMDISVTDFKAHCLDLIRKVEKSGQPVTIKRRGKIVARLEPARGADEGLKPWEQLRALGGRVHATTGESVLKDEDFEAAR